MTTIQSLPDSPAATGLAALTVLEAEGRRYDEGFWADRTWKEYRTDGRYFTDWRDWHRAESLPALLAAAALHLANAAGIYEVSTLRRRLAAISVVHHRATAIAPPPLRPKSEPACPALLSRRPVSR